MNTDEKYLLRCLELAKRGAGTVAPNPMVGAVLVHEDKIISEGWHKRFGEAHAEADCLRQAEINGHSSAIPFSTLYVSLEPCAHFGKTAPCADLIIKNRIPRVLIGCPDPFPEVDGKGIAKMVAAGIDVKMADKSLMQQCIRLNKRFFTFHQQKRPFIILKWAQTADGFIASHSSDERLHISNEFSNRLVHKWRSEEAAILVGTNTALKDDPELTTRLWQRRSAIRLVVDMDLRLPVTLKIFDRQSRTIIFNARKQEEKDGILYYQLDPGKDLISELPDALFRLDIQSVLVEGGAKLLNSFISAGMWDEARIIHASANLEGPGLPAPLPANGISQREEIVGSDRIEWLIPGRSAGNNPGQPDSTYGY